LARRSLRRRAGAGGLALWLRSRPAGSGAAPAPASAGPASAPSPGPAPLALPEAAGAWRAEGPASTWDRESIFSYIDGHAEVYLAYGMRRCISRRYSGPAGEGAITLDAFELASPYDAFGVFTHDRDGEAAGVGRDRCSATAGSRSGRPVVRLGRGEKESDASRTTVLALGRRSRGSLRRRRPAPPVVSALPQRPRFPERALPARPADPRHAPLRRRGERLRARPVDAGSRSAATSGGREGGPAPRGLPEASAAARAQSPSSNGPARGRRWREGRGERCARGRHPSRRSARAGNEALARALLEEALRGDAATPAAAKGGRP